MNWIVCLLFLPVSALSFVLPSTTNLAGRTTNVYPKHGFVDSRTAVCLRDVAAGSSVLLAEESWRQYVPLVVSLLVITDILLGSPVAGTILSFARPTTDDDNDTYEGGAATTTLTKGKPIVQKTKERVDTSKIAKDALERANAALQWRVEREKLKTDSERMEDIRRKMDDQMREFDEKTKRDG